MAQAGIGASRESTTGEDRHPCAVAGCRNHATAILCGDHWRLVPPPLGAAMRGCRRAVRGAASPEQRLKAVIAYRWSLAEALDRVAAATRPARCDGGRSAATSR